MHPLAVSELFYSLQGEGARAGEPSLFIRLQGCTVKHACWQYGIRCDTEFESGSRMSLEELAMRVLALASDCRWIIWTGGEPLDQLTEEVVRFFQEKGYYQALETSGAKPLPQGVRFDHLTISPKVAEHVLRKHFDGVRVHELRYVRHTGQTIPRPALLADHYYLSPHFDGLTPNEENIRHCIRLCLEHPPWSLSLQSHKLVQIL